MLRSACFRRVRSLDSAPSGAVLQSTPHTPRSKVELANMLRDPAVRIVCPYGADFAKDQAAASRLDRTERMPFWLALMELHSYDYRYGQQGTLRLPGVFEEAVELVKGVRQQIGAHGAASVLVGPEALAQALLANPVTRHKIAVHDLLHYCLKKPEAHMAAVTTEELTHGSVMAPASLLPAAAALEVAKIFFDFAVQQQLAPILQKMSPGQIQVVALFLCNLLKKPPQRVCISERLDLTRLKPSYIPSCAIISPQVLVSTRRQGPQCSFLPSSPGFLTPLKGRSNCRCRTLPRSQRPCTMWQETAGSQSTRRRRQLCRRQLYASCAETASWTPAASGDIA